MKQGLVTIGLVTWNGEKYMRACLDSLARQTTQDFVLYVYDNGSTDQTVAIAREYYEVFGERITIIENKENSGFAKGHNAIFSWATTPYCMVLNQDIVLDQEYLKRCISVLEVQPQAGVVSGKILIWDFEKGDTKEAYTSLVDSCGLTIRPTGRVFERGIGKQSDLFVGVQKVFGVSGTIPIYRKEALDSVRFGEEYFDESFFSYKEDVDLAFRLQWAGWDAYVVCDALGYHDRSAKSTENMSMGESWKYRKSKRSMINYHSYKNHLMMLYKNMSAGVCMRVGLFVFLYELQKFFFVLFFETKTLASLATLFGMRSELRKKKKYIQQSKKRTGSQMARWFFVR